MSKWRKVKVKRTDGSLCLHSLTVVDLNCSSHMWIDGRVSHWWRLFHRCIIRCAHMGCVAKSPPDFSDGNVHRMQIDRWSKTFVDMLNLDWWTIDCHTMVKNRIYRVRQMWLAREMFLLPLYYRIYSHMSRVANGVQSFEIQIWLTIWKNRRYEMCHWYALHDVIQIN